MKETGAMKMNVSLYIVFRGRVKVLSLTIYYVKHTNSTSRCEYARLWRLNVCTCVNLNPLRWAQEFTQCAILNSEF